MHKSASHGEPRQPAKQQDAEVEKLYDSCCGSCGSPAPTDVTVTVQDLTMVPSATGTGAGNSNP